jgi:sec-independent protein translocase protein TatA
MLSPVDTAVIAGLALLLFGPKKFPEIGKALGQGLGNFKKALTEAQDEVKAVVKPDEKPLQVTSEEEHKPG